jgi:hypothetical protein
MLPGIPRETPIMASVEAKWPVLHSGYPSAQEKGKFGGKLGTAVGAQTTKSANWLGMGSWALEIPLR